MVIQTTMRFMELRTYDKKNKSTGEKTGEQGNILQLLEINDKGNVTVNTYFPNTDQLLTIGGTETIQFMDKVNVTLELESAGSKPRFVSLGDVAEIAHITYAKRGEILKSVK